MGTSKGYEAPTGPQWGDLKGDVTRSVGRGPLSSTQVARILGKLIAAYGGARSLSRAQETVAGRRTATNLGTFAGNVADAGLDEALRRAGLERLIGRPAGEIVLSLTDELCGDGSTLDEVDARKAVADLNKELLEDAEDYAEVSAILEKRLQPDALGDMMFKFFGHYLYHKFCRIFYERLVRKHGEEKADSSLKDIRAYVSSELAYATLDRDLTVVDWDGPEGRDIAHDVLERTLEVFER